MIRKRPRPRKYLEDRLKKDRESLRSLNSLRRVYQQDTEYVRRLLRTENL